MSEGGLHRTQGGLRNKSHEELDIKDDKRKPRRIKPGSLLRAIIPKMRRRRVLVAALALFLLWTFTYYRLPASQWKTSISARPAFPGSPPASNDGRPLAASPPSPGRPPPRPKQDKAADGEHYYDGDIMFYMLPTSLNGIARTYGHRPSNHNVLFAASSLKSVAVLIPLACDMAKHVKNYVHLAVMGRSDLSIEEILEINGVDKAQCKVFWHDARPDYAAYSTESRAEASVSNALRHFQMFMHPQAIITDGLIAEDGFFVRALKQKTMEYNIPLIELPANNAERLAWLTRLEARALAAWHNPTVDVLIQVQPDSTGSLIRLLTSLHAADFAGLALPRLIIELPHEIDPIAQNYLSNFRWPPPTPWPSDSGRSNLLHVRRRIPSERLSAEEASVRFLESFYPANPADSHVLLLSPRAQVSPLFFHYLKYHLLEYHYSTYDSASSILLGLSLEIPSTHLNGTAPFDPPTADVLDEAQLRRVNPPSSDIRLPFLWQAPNSNAALYFGSKWVELHSFLSNRLQRFHASPSNATQRPKLVSTAYPAWAEYFLEFMRARGYALLYPGSTSADEALVTIHNDLYQPPEEFLNQSPPTAPSDPTASARDPDLPNLKEPFKAPASLPTSLPSHPENPLAPPSRLLPAVLPFQIQPPLSSLPHLSANGTLLDPQTSSSDAEQYADAFRVEVGGCTTARFEGRKRVVKAGSARDLFCFAGGTAPEAEFEDLPSETVTSAG